MTAFDIKVIAILLMVIDHIGLFFFPNILLFRIIGRLSFPLFAYLLANGAYHTKNINSYLKRLFIFALISQIPYFLATSKVIPNFNQLNIFFTLLLGLIAIKTIKQTKKRYVWLAIALITALLGELIHVSYGARGVLSIILFYVFFGDFKKIALTQTALLLYLLPTSQINLWSLLSFASLLSLIFVQAYNHKEGRKVKYLFYFFYPIQYLVILVVKLLV